MRNAGKSSLVNAITGQELSVVSQVKGTTTDPVRKAMELLPLGPVLIIDTPGWDDEGELGTLRVQKTKRVLAETDLAVLVVDAENGLTETDRQLIAWLEERKTPYLIAYNKADLLPEYPAKREREIWVSAKEGHNISALKEWLGAFARPVQKRVVADLLEAGDLVVLVTPIDESAPRGRLILPQQQTIRDILDARCTAIVVQDTELRQTLSRLSVRPKLVITDSQVFGRVAKDVPEDWWLTSFSILFARYKGELSELVKGAARLAALRDEDRVLIAEGCTHHRQCNDIGTVKLPGWITNGTKKKLQFSFTSGSEFPETLQDFALVVHCGGCMLNETEMKHRIATAVAAGVPIVNYGIAIAHLNGILWRSLAPFPEMRKLLEAYGIQTVDRGYP